MHLIREAGEKRVFKIINGASKIAILRRRTHGYSKTCATRQKRQFRRKTVAVEVPEKISIKKETHPQEALPSRNVRLYGFLRFV